MYNQQFIERVWEKRRGSTPPEKRHPLDIRRSRQKEAMAVRREPVLPGWAKTILLDVCKRHGLEPGLVAGPCMTPRVVACRDEAVWLMRNDDRKPSLPMLGRWFGRDHTSILTALRRYEARSA